MHNHLQFDPIWIMLCSEKMPLADRQDAIPTKCDWWVSPNTLTNLWQEFSARLDALIWLKAGRSEFGKWQNRLRISQLSSGI
jgi:hypothetical protein